MSAADNSIEADRIALWRGVSGRFQRRFLALAAALIAFEVAFYFAYAYGMGFASARASPFWLPESILFCALLRSPKRYWWIFIVAPLPIRLFTSVQPNHPLWFMLGAHAIDVAQALVAAIVLRKVLGELVRLESFRDFGLFALVAALAVPAIGALAGAGLRYGTGHDFWSSWLQWWVGNALAQLMITPAILTWLAPDISRIKRVKPVRAVEFVVTLGGLAGTSYAALQGRPLLSSFGPFFYAPVLYMPVPFLYWAAFRFGLAGASIAVPVFALFSVAAAAAAGGALADYSVAQTPFFLQTFLIFRTLPAYLVATLIEQRNRSERLLSES